MVLMDTAEAQLRRRVAGDLGIHLIEEPVWEDVVDTDHVRDALLNAHDSEDPAYNALKSRVARLRERFLGHRPRERWLVSSWPSLEKSYTPYVVTMTVAVGRSEPTTEMQRVPGFRDPIVTGLVDGRIRVEAEPWMPVRSITRTFREWQLSLLDEGRTRTRAISPESLEQFLWIRVYRTDHPEEGWRATMTAWNRAHPRREWYDDVRNFERDFRRTEEHVEHARQMCRRVAGWEGESAEDSLRYERAGIKGIRVTRKRVRK
jgi:hypothetical protein